MYFTDDSLLPENQQPLMITVAPYGPQWMPSDYPEDIPVSWDAQVQKAVDCYNAGATVLHIHVRDPATGRISKKFSDYGYLIERLREAVPKMVLQVGGSISFAPEPGQEAHWHGYDTRQMLAEINPKPDQITIVIGSTQMNILPLTTPDDVAGTHLENPALQKAYQNMVADATPEFYIWYDSIEETLANLGLPPNRKDGQLGFIVKETDGRLRPASAEEVMPPSG